MEQMSEASLQSIHRGFPLRLKAVAALMIGYSMWQIIAMYLPPSQASSQSGLFAAVWALVALCGIGVFLRMDSARIFGALLLSLIAVLYFFVLSIVVLVSAFSNQYAPTAAQFLVALFTPLIMLVCVKILIGSGWIGRPDVSLARAEP
ncbi:MAG: hypothetical protein ACNA8P_07235 [Phycisphaerales bacterium]